MPAYVSDYLPKAGCCSTIRYFHAFIFVLTIGPFLIRTKALTIAASVFLDSIIIKP